MIRIIKNFLLKRKLNKAPIGVSSDSSVHIENLPVGPFPPVGRFFKIAKDLGSFEVTGISKERGTVTVTEVCTENEVEISLSAFELLFQALPVKRLVIKSK